MTTDVWTAVFTPVANKDAAIALGGGFSFNFAAFCTPEPPDENGEWPNGPSSMWCFGAGPINPGYRADYIAAAVAAPLLYWVVRAPASTAVMLANHPQGPMYRYIPPEV